jgi:AbrB family looped-hinge helix DNA binding protein
MKTSLSSKGQIVLPAEIRKHDRLRAGQQFAVERVQEGEYVLRKLDEPEEFDLIDWLLSCPVKGWFQPMPADSTADIRTFTDS